MVEGLVLCVSPSGLTVAFGGGGSSPSDGGRISKDLVVVQADGVTLVCPKDRAQDIKQLVVELREKGGYDGLL